VHFGLKAATKIDSVEVRWPSGRIEILKNLDAVKFLFGAGRAGNCGGGKNSSGRLAGLNSFSPHFSFRQFFFQDVSLRHSVPRAMRALRRVVVERPHAPAVSDSSILVDDV